MSLKGIPDNRWRPDFESSQRRIRDELEEDTPVRFSRELSFVPEQRRPRLDAYDAQTRALIQQRSHLERLPDGGTVLDLVEEWSLIDRMKTGDEKQRFLEAKIEKVQRDPVANQALLTFLLVAFEPVRRSVSRAFVRVHSGLAPEERDICWANREEARLMRHAAREALYDVTREGALEAIYRYPLHKPPARFFIWLRNTIAHRALEKLTGELPAAATTGSTRATAEALQDVLSGLTEQQPPELRDRTGMRKWRKQIEMRDVFEIVAEFFQSDPVRDACRTAIGRLPERQREVIDACYYREVGVPDLAATRNVSPSTIYNQKSQAQRRMSEDDVFFSQLYALQEVRDHARAKYLRETYPDGKLPDGRRIVLLDQEAA